MAKRPDEQYERVKMKDLNPEEDDDDWGNDVPRPSDIDETNLDDSELGDTTISNDSEMDVTVINTDIDDITEDEFEEKRLWGLRNVFFEITGVPIEAKDNESLFSKSRILIGKRGFKTLWYDGEKIYYKTKGPFSKWTVYTKFALRNPMEAEFEKAKENYKVSARKQINEEAGVNVPEDVSKSIRMNVFRDLSDERLNDDEPKIATTSVDSELPTSIASKIGTVDVEKLQVRLRTLEKVIDDQQKFFMKSTGFLMSLELETLMTMSYHQKNKKLMIFGKS